MSIFNIGDHGRHRRAAHRGRPAGGARRGERAAGDRAPGLCAAQRLVDRDPRAGDARDAAARRGDVRLRLHRAAHEEGGRLRQPPVRLRRPLAAEQAAYHGYTARGIVHVYHRPAVLLYAHRQPDHREPAVTAARLGHQIAAQQRLEEVEHTRVSRIDRAHLLYNHMWHSSLSGQHLDELYFEKRYRDIIDHRNFNPRLIRFITDSERVADVNGADYWAYIQEMLTDPSRIWEHPFEAQHDDFGRAIVLLVTLDGRTVTQEAVAEAFSRYTARPESAGRMASRYGHPSRIWSALARS